jgi:dipeptidyl-peptidase-4
LQFAKFSPDGSKVAYVSEHNIYVEDLASGNIKKLTDDNGTKKTNQRHI